MSCAVEQPTGEDRVVVLVECRLKNEGDMEVLRRNVHAAILRASGVNCEVALVAPRSLPFTSSGKLSRVQARMLYVSGEILEIGGRKTAAPLRVAAAN